MKAITNFLIIIFMISTVSIANANEIYKQLDKCFIGNNNPVCTGKKFIINFKPKIPNEKNNSLVQRQLNVLKKRQEKFLTTKKLFYILKEQNEEILEEIQKLTEDLD